MKTRVTITHLARHLDVHPSTISLALRDSPEVSAAMKQRIHALARRWRYTPNHVARSLRQRSTMTLGVLFPYASPPFYGALLDALDAEADSRGLHLEVHFHQWNAAQEAEAMRTLYERRVDGLIVMPATPESQEKLEEVIPPDVDFPVVILSAPMRKRFPRFVRACVATDTCEGSRELGDYLLRMGHRRIALLLPSSNIKAPAIHMRVTGLRAAMQKHKDARLVLVSASDAAELINEGNGDARRLYTAHDTFQLSRRLADEALRLEPRPTAMIATDETAAHVLLAKLHMAGLRVPEDVSVACYGGTFLSEFGAVPLTCVHQPFEQMARATIEIVAASRARAASSRCEIRLLPPKLVIRSSVAAPRAVAEMGSNQGG